MEKTKYLSVLITAYKSGDYISECLDSIENQTYFKDNDNYEILLGIDGCKETLDKVLACRHKYRNLRIFNMDKNRGTFITMNTLLKISKGDIYLRFDSDDIARPDMVQTLMSEEEGFEMVHCNYRNFKDGFVLDHQPAVKFSVGTALFKKSIFKRFGAYKPWICGADTELYYKIEKFYKIKKIEKILFDRRVHENNLTVRKETGLKSSLRMGYANEIRYNKIIGFPVSYVIPVISDYVEV